MKNKRAVIVGRPNVGKSSLFNALLGFRRAIVFAEPGTTLDDVCEPVQWDGIDLDLMDSQGILDEGDVKTLERVLEKGDLYLFVVDAAAGITPFDRWIARHLYAHRKPTLLCVNKIEATRATAESEFAVLGFENILGTSAAHRINVPEIKRWVASETEDLEGFVSADRSGAEKTEEGGEAAPAVQKPLTLALIGRPNTGKSTLMNRLCEENVSIVSAQPLTTRDPVSFRLETEEGKIRIVDTAGMRRPRSKKDGIEVFSIHASTRTVREADVVFLCLSSAEGVSDQDMRLLNLLVREGKPCAVLLNFWDKLSSKERKSFFENDEMSRHLEPFRCVPISGLTGFNIEQCIPLAFKLWKQSQRRIKTSRVNDVLKRIVQKNPPPVAGEGKFNILYGSQVSTSPPTFVFFMNRRGALPKSYQKYMENQLKDGLGFRGQNIRLLFRSARDRA